MPSELTKWWNHLKGKFRRKETQPTTKTKKSKPLTFCQQRKCKFSHQTPNQKTQTHQGQTKLSTAKGWLLKIILALALFAAFLFLSRSAINWITKVREALSFLLGLFFWAICGLLAGAALYALTKNKGKIVLDNTPEFLEFCKQSNGLVFWGSYGSGKTALMALLAHELTEENKYASFPCNLPWMERAQVDFAYPPSQPLGVKEVIFLDEINLLFKGNEFQQARERQRFLAHFFALSRHQGTKIFINGQRLGQVWIELREVATTVCQVALLQRTDEGIYVKVEIWQASAWNNEKTEREFVIFIGKQYLDTYNSYWLKGLKYLRSGQGYV
ncbi:MAG: plectrovirus SVGII3 orf 2 transmembrane protein [Mycoplasmataceae bacterium CE_OT135]|nr:MAG: plectrovirus SVGII3 orf 2 transmembrane protein [Mycoplasmataceae bacterium CE_OT135]